MYASGSPTESAIQLPNPGESIGLIPLAPPVRSNPVPRKSSPLRATWGMISPKPSVTIAR